MRGLVIGLLWLVATFANAQVYKFELIVTVIAPPQDDASAIQMSAIGESGAKSGTKTIIPSIGNCKIDLEFLQNPGGHLQLQTDNSLWKFRVEKVDLYVKNRPYYVELVSSVTINSRAFSSYKLRLDNEQRHKDSLLALLKEMNNSNLDSTLLARMDDMNAQALLISNEYNTQLKELINTFDGGSHSNIYKHARNYVLQGDIERAYNYLIAQLNTNNVLDALEKENLIDAYRLLARLCVLSNRIEAADKYYSNEVMQHANATIYDKLEYANFLINSGYIDRGVRCLEGLISEPLVDNSKPIIAYANLQLGFLLSVYDNQKGGACLKLAHEMYYELNKKYASYSLQVKYVEVIRTFFDKTYASKGGIKIRQIVNELTNKMVTREDSLLFLPYISMYNMLVDDTNSIHQSWYLVNNESQYYYSIYYFNSILNGINSNDTSRTKELFGLYKQYTDEITFPPSLKAILYEPKKPFNLTTNFSSAFAFNAIAMQYIAVVVNLYAKDYLSYDSCISLLNSLQRNIPRISNGNDKVFKMLYINIATSKLLLSDSRLSYEYLERWSDIVNKSNDFYSIDSSKLGHILLASNLYTASICIAKGKYFAYILPSELDKSARDIAEKYYDSSISLFREAKESTVFVTDKYINVSYILKNAKKVRKIIVKKGRMSNQQAKFIDSYYNKMLNGAY